VLLRFVGGFVAEAAVVLEVVGDVVADGVGEGGEGVGVAGLAEAGDVGAGEVLVFFAQGFGHVDEVDGGWAAEGGEDGVGEVDPGLGGAGAEVVEAGGEGGLGELEGHADGVFDVEEVAFLFAVAVVRAMGFEEAEAAGGGDLAEGFVDDAAHVGLVVFVGAEDVEVFEADDAAEPALAFGVEVEEVLRVAVHVEGAEALDVVVGVVHAE
jgi:hypothetical protein